MDIAAVVLVVDFGVEVGIEVVALVVDFEFAFWVEVGIEVVASVELVF